MSTPHPAKSAPQRVTLEGRYTRLEPIGPQHAADLYRAASKEPQRFEYLFDEPPASEDEMHAFIATAASKDDPMMWAVIDKATGTAEGRQTLLRTVVKDGVIELGGIFWGPGMARRRTATEAVFLHARYIFDVLGNRRFEWKCNNRNEPSKAAATRFGFQFEGVFRQHMIQKGLNRDTAWFSILDSEWPRLKAEFERWLDPANFDAAGNQKSKLTT